MIDPPCPFVSRGGLKLAAALDAFAVDVNGQCCADLGCNVGGFTDCLLQRGAAQVISVDTGYGTLAWRLRQDKRVTVMERQNALHLDPAKVEGFAGCDLVVIDLGWTPQSLAIPAALRWLKSGDPESRARIITLIKPHYETKPSSTKGPKRGVLDEAQSQEVAMRVIEQLPSLGVSVLGHIVSPIRGGASRGLVGNVEYLALLKRKG